MPVRVCLLVVFATLAACDPAPQARTHSMSPVDGRVDLTGEFAGQWDEVCVLAPYATNGQAREVLGVAVNLRDSSRIWNSDGIALLVTMNDRGIAGMFEVPLRPVDFTPLAGCCFSRDDAAFGVSGDGDVFTVREATAGVPAAAACE